MIWLSYSNSMYFKATNPREFIYGILGLCKEEQRNVLRVDYSAPVEAIYLETARALCHNDGIQLLLSSDIGTVLNRRPNLASWVPDWEAAQGGVRHWDGDHEKQIMHANNFVKPEIKLLDGDILQLSGYRIDHIEQLGPVLYDPAPGDREWSIADIKQLAQKYEELRSLVVNSPAIQDPLSVHNIYSALKRGCLEDFDR